MKNLIVGILALGVFSAFAKDLPAELDALNGDYTLVSGHERCDETISIWGYESLSINIEVFNDIYFNEINEGRSTGRCMDGIGSKMVYKTTYDDRVLTNFVSKKRIGCFTPKRFVKLEKESEIEILENDQIKLSMIMRSNDPVVCIYSK